MTVTDAAGPAIVYPNYGTSTRLDHNASLEDNETDVVRFRIDADELSVGTHTLHIEATYARGGVPGPGTGPGTVGGT